MPKGKPFPFPKAGFKAAMSAKKKGKKKKGKK